MSTSRSDAFTNSRFCLAVRRVQQLAIAFICIAIALTFFTTPATAQALPTSQKVAAETVTATQSAATLFEQNCAGCHANGGNIIRRGKNLRKKAMERNGYGEVNAIAQIITHGKGIMSAYGDRLNEEEIGAIAQYVHEQSEAGW